MQETTLPPHVILQFDVNGTLILEDSTKKETDEYMLICALAKNTFAEWGIKSQGEEELDRMSFKDYVDHVLLPGDKSDRALKKKRQEHIAGFLNWLTDHSHACKDHVLEDYHKIRELFTDSAEGKVNFSIFPSFYVMLNKLREMEIPFTLVLRSFGHDLPKIVDEIEKHSSGVKFTHWGKLNGTQLTIQEGEIIERIEDIFECFLTSDSHFAVQDDWETWNRDGEHSRSGKPFLYDISGTRRVKNLSLFFDDNITGEEFDIVRPCEISGQNETTRSLCERLIFPVNTRDAALDENYFISRVLRAIRSSEETT